MFEAQSLTCLRPKLLNMGQIERVLCSQTLGTNMLKFIRFVPRVWLHRMLLRSPMLSKFGLKNVRLWASNMPELGGD